MSDLTLSAETLAALTALLKENEELLPLWPASKRNGSGWYQAVVGDEMMNRDAAGKIAQFAASSANNLGPLLHAASVLAQVQKLRDKIAEHATTKYGYGSNTQAELRGMLLRDLLALLDPPMEPTT